MTAPSPPPARSRASAGSSSRSMRFGSPRDACASGGCGGGIGGSGGGGGGSAFGYGGGGPGRRRRVEVCVRGWSRHLPCQCLPRRRHAAPVRPRRRDEQHLRGVQRRRGRAADRTTSKSAEVGTLLPFRAEEAGSFAAATAVGAVAQAPPGPRFLYCCQHRLRATLPGAKFSRADCPRRHPPPHASSSRCPRNGQPLPAAVVPHARPAAPVSSRPQRRRWSWASSSREPRLLRRRRGPGSYTGAPGARACRASRRPAHRRRAAAAGSATAAAIAVPPPSSASPSASPPAGGQPREADVEVIKVVGVGRRRVGRPLDWRRRRRGGRRLRADDADVDADVDKSDAASSARRRHRPAHAAAI